MWLNPGKDPGKMTLMLEVIKPGKELEQIYQVFFIMRMRNTYVLIITINDFNLSKNFNILWILAFIPESVLLSTKSPLSLVINLG